jgi:hypothetical protein
MATTIVVVDGADGLTPDMLRKRWHGTLQGPLHGPWPRPDAATERMLNTIVSAAFTNGYFQDPMHD